MSRTFPRRAGTCALATVLGLALLAGCSDDESSSTKADEQPTVSAATPTNAPDAQPAPSQLPAHRPTALTLPSGTKVTIDESATTASGELAIPTDVDRAGWWDGSARLGDPFGGIVVAAHIDSFDEGLGRFAELLSVRPGDEIEVSGGSLTQRFRIASAELVPKSAVDADSDIYTVRGPTRLVLITCGGAYDSAEGGYQDNLVVIAQPDGPARTTGS